MTTAYIYALVDPRDKQVRYVGKTINPEKRFKSHVSSNPNSANESAEKCTWILDLREQGLRPIMNIIEEIAGRQSIDREMYWIEKYRKDGCSLVNSNRRYKSKPAKVDLNLPEEVAEEEDKVPA